MKEFTGIYDKNDNPIHVGDELVVSVSRAYNPQSYHDRKRYPVTLRVEKAHYPTVAEIEQGARTPDFNYAHWKLVVVDQSEVDAINEPMGHETFKRYARIPTDLVEVAYSFRLGKWAYDYRPVLATEKSEGK